MKNYFESDNNDPVCSRDRRMSLNGNSMVRGELEKMLVTGIVMPTYFSWSCTVVI